MALSATCLPFVPASSLSHAFQCWRPPLGHAVTSSDTCRAVCAGLEMRSCLLCWRALSLSLSEAHSRPPRYQPCLSRRPRRTSHAGAFHSATFLTNPHCAVHFVPAKPWPSSLYAGHAPGRALRAGALTWASPWRLRLVPRAGAPDDLIGLRCAPCAGSVLHDPVRSSDL